MPSHIVSKICSFFNLSYHHKLVNCDLTMREDNLARDIFPDFLALGFSIWRRFVDITFYTAFTVATFGVAALLDCFDWKL